jgi:hypothetical protein
MRTQIQAYEDTDRAASYFVEEHSGLDRLWVTRLNFFVLVSKASKASKFSYCSK